MEILAPKPKIQDGLFAKTETVLKKEKLYIILLHWTFK